MENRKNRKRTALFFVLGCIWMLQGCALKEQFGDLLTEALKQDETKLKQDEEDTGEFVQPQKPEDTEQAKPVTISGETEAAPQLEAEDGEYAAYYAYRTLDDTGVPDGAAYDFGTRGESRASDDGCGRTGRGV